MGEKIEEKTRVAVDKSTQIRIIPIGRHKCAFHSNEIEYVSDG